MPHIPLYLRAVRQAHEAGAPLPLKLRLRLWKLAKRDWRLA
jgi:hypothetical protein